MSSLARVSLGTMAIAGIYFAVPVRVDREFWVRAILAALGLGLATYLVVRQLRRPGAPILRLALAIVGSVFVFALADYVVAVMYPGQFTGLDTRINGSTSLCPRWRQPSDGVQPDRSGDRRVDPGREAAFAG